MIQLLIVGGIWLLIFVTVFGISKICKNRRKLYYKILLAIGLIPFIWNLIISINAGINGFQLFDFLPTHGIKAFVQCFNVYLVFGFVIFIPAIILIIVAVFKLIKIYKIEKKRS